MQDTHDALPLDRACANASRARARARSSSDTGRGRAARAGRLPAPRGPFGPGFAARTGR